MNNPIEDCISQSHICNRANSEASLAQKEEMFAKIYNVLHHLKPILDGNRGKNRIEGVFIIQAGENEFYYAGFGVSLTFKNLK